MKNDEGYIKFQADWVKSEALPLLFLSDLIETRGLLYEMGLIGVYPEGVGYGNISKRWDASGRFAISGTATGHLKNLGPEHFSLVTQIDIPSNRLHCQGPALASSESMSHAAIYLGCPDINAVIHVHDLAMWEKWIGKAPTTPESASYGSPEMAEAISELLADPSRKTWKFLVMAGHREGCISFGKDLEEAMEALLFLRR